MANLPRRPFPARLANGGERVNEQIGAQQQLLSLKRILSFPQCVDDPGQDIELFLFRLEEASASALLHRFDHPAALGGARVLRSASPLLLATQGSGQEMPGMEILFPKVRPQPRD